MSVDTLSLARELRAAEIAPSQAEAIAAAIGRAVAETSATKADLIELRTASKADLQHAEAGLKADIQAVNVKIDAVDMRLGARIDTSTAELRGEIEKSKNQLLFWLISTQFAVGGIIIALIKFLPSQG